MSVTLGKGGDTMSQTCQRALAMRGNVVIDTEACRKDPGDAGVNATNQIAGKVDKRSAGNLDLVTHTQIGDHERPNLSVSPIAICRLLFRVLAHRSLALR